MANVLLPIVPGNFPVGYCFPATPQEFLVDIAAHLQALLEGGMAFYNYGSTVPAPENQGYPWLRTTDMRWYRFDGNWISPNPETSAEVRRLFIGPESGAADGVWTYDGGDGSDPSAVVPTDRTGAMWEVDHNFDGRSPMGPGNIPSANPATVLAVNTNAGEGAHVMSDQEVGPHSHLLPQGYEIDGLNATPKLCVDADTLTPTLQLSTNNNTYTAGQQAMPIIHPVRGVFLLKRTARAYYVAV